MVTSTEIWQKNNVLTGHTPQVLTEEEKLSGLWPSCVRRKHDRCRTLQPLLRPFYVVAAALIIFVAVFWFALNHDKAFTNLIRSFSRVRRCALRYLPGLPAAHRYAPSEESFR